MDPFHYYPEYRILIYKSCQYAIQPNRLITHLRAKQHRLSRQQSKQIANQYRDKQLTDLYIECIVLSTIIDFINYLPIYRDGLACKHCHYICRSHDWILRHQREVHDIQIGRGRRSIEVEWIAATWCQCFFISVGQHYFPVRQTNEMVSNQTLS
jgi:Orsellinic acid/F9775 biosynthesis cluster protein D